MSKLDKLKRLRARKTQVAKKVGAAVKESPKRGKRSPLEGVLMESFIAGAQSIGSLDAAARGGWPTRTHELCEGVAVDIATTPGTVLEIDAFDLVEQIVKSASALVPRVRKSALQGRRVARALVQGVEDDLELTLRVAIRMLSFQGWKEIRARGRLRSPTWVYPPIMLNTTTVVDLIRDEIAYQRGGLISEQVTEPDPVDPNDDATDASAAPDCLSVLNDEAGEVAEPDEGTVFDAEVDFVDVKTVPTATGCTVLDDLEDA